MREYELRNVHTGEITYACAATAWHLRERGWSAQDWEIMSWEFV